MAIIIETCPKCGHDLVDAMICTNPPIPMKRCPSCGWSWEGEREEVIRIPFGGNSFNYDDNTYTLQGDTDYGCINNLSTSASIYNDNAINMGEAMDALTKAFKDIEVRFEKESLMGDFEQPACVHCPNNIKNGGNGFCHCILGQIPIT